MRPFLPAWRRARRLVGLTAWAVWCGCSLLHGQGVAPADPRLARAYRQCHFSEQYPPAAVKEIQDKLQNAPRAVEVLAQLAKDTRHEIRLLVALLLGELGEQDAAKVLWSLLQDDLETVRVAASGALIRSYQLVEAPPDFAALKDPRPEVRRLAVATLGRIASADILPELVRATDDENEQVRMEAVRAISEKRDERVKQALIKRLQDSSVEVRTAAARGLSAYRDPEAINALRGAFKDPDWHVRAAAVFAVAAYAHPAFSQAEITDAIINILRSDEFALVRDRAADALAFANAEQTVNALVEALVSDNRNVSFHAARAICTGRCTGALPLLAPHCTNANAEVRLRVLEVFGALGSTNELAAVSQAVNDRDPAVRVAAVSALQKIGQRAGARVLLEKLNDDNPHVRAAAARALGHLQEPNTAPRLRPLLHDPYGFVRSAAAEALGRLGDRAAVPLLISLLAGLDPASGMASGLVVQAKNELLLPENIKFDAVEQRKAVVAALGELRASEAVEPLLKYGLKSDSLDVQAFAAYSLGQIGDPRAVNPLQEAVRDYYEQLSRLGSSEIIFQDRPTTGGGGGWRPTREKEARVRAAVVWALGEIGDPAAEPTLKRALNDDNSLVRDNAAEALDKLRLKQERAQLKTATAAPPSSGPAPDKSRSASGAQTR